VVFDEKPLARGLSLVERPAHVEAALWRRLRVQNDLACRELIFRRHLEFARKLARREWRHWPPEGVERGDFEQFAFAALLDCIDRFDPLRSTAFEAFARARLKGAIADGARRASEKNAQYSFQRRLQNERVRALREHRSGYLDPVLELGELAALLAIGLIAEQAARQEESDPRLGGYQSSAWRALELSLLNEITRLSQNERTVIEQHYLEGVAFAEIAVLLQLTPGRVSQLHKSALAKLRDRLKPVE